MSEAAGGAARPAAIGLDPVPSALDLAGVGVVRDGVDLLADVTWRVGRDERWAVLGPNGSGKTTLLRVAGASLWPTRGSVTVLGARIGTVDLRRLRRRIAVVSASVTRALRPALGAAARAGHPPPRGGPARHHAHRAAPAWPCRRRRTGRGGPRRWRRLRGLRLARRGRPPRRALHGSGKDLRTGNGAGASPSPDRTPVPDGNRAGRCGVGRRVTSARRRSTGDERRREPGRGGEGGRRAA